MEKIAIIDITPWRNAALGLFGRALEGRPRSILVVVVLAVAAAAGGMPLMRIADRSVEDTSFLHLLFTLAGIVSSLYLLLFLFVIFYRLGARQLLAPVLIGVQPPRIGIGVRCRILRRAVPYFGVTASVVAGRLSLLRRQIDDAGARRIRRRRLLARTLRATCILLPLSILGAAAVAQETTEPEIWGLPAAILLAGLGVLMFLLSRTLAAAPVSLQRRRRSSWLRATGAVTSYGAGYAGYLALMLAAVLILLAVVGAMGLIGIDTAAIKASPGLSTAVGMILVASGAWIFPKVFALAESLIRRGAARGAEAKRQILPDASEAMGADRRSPVLFLRSFADDVLQVEGRRYEPMAAREKESFEEILVANLSSYGPVIAIAEPGRQPLSGAARAYFKTDEWQPRVLDWMERSRLIAIVVGQTRGIQWEIEKILAHRHIAKTLLFLPPSAQHRERWSVICRLLEGTPWGEIATKLDTAQLRAVYFASDGRAILFTSASNREIDYRLAAQFAVYGLLCHGAGSRRA